MKFWNQFWKKTKNKGFTLVELVVTIAIMTIVGGAITSFIVVAQKNYNYGSAETDLQTQAQLVVNQLQDLMIDAAKGISYTYKKEVAEGEASNDLYLQDDSEITDGDVVETKTLYIYDSNKYYELKWDADTREIRYKEYAKDVAPDDSQGELLAEFVKSFSVDLRKLGSNRTVEYFITMEKEVTGKSYTTSHKIKLRNEVLVNRDRDDVYDGDDEDRQSVPSRITIGLDNPYIWPGESRVLSKLVEANDGGIASQTVNWNLEGNSFDGTTINNNTDTLTAGLSDEGVESGTFHDGIGEHTLKISASKPLEAGGVLDSINSLAVYVRGITEIKTHDYLDNGDDNTTTTRTVTAGKQGVTVVADITGYNLVNNEGNELTNEEKGGATISITAGREYLSSDPIIVENSGTITFDIRDDISFESSTDTKQLKLTFCIKQPGFTNIKCDVVYEIVKDEPIIINAPDDWERDGTIDIALGNIQEEYLDRRADGTIWIKGDKEITVDFRYISSDGTKTDWHRLGNQGTYGTGQDTNSYVSLSFETGNVLNLTATLKRDKFAYSSPYSETTYWNSYSDVVQIEMKVDFGGYQQSEIKVFNIADVVFEYRNSSPNDTNDGIWTEGTHKVYVTNQDSIADNKYKVYYQFTDGWDGNNFQLNNSRFVGVGSDGNRYDLEITNSSSGSLHWIEFQMPDSLIGNNQLVIQEIYEYNPWFGKTTDYLKSDGEKLGYDKVTGCEGIVEFHFVDPNVKILYSNVKPVGMYCPRFEDAKTDNYKYDSLRDGYYYYINEQSRYFIYMDQGQEKAIYEEWENFDRTLQKPDWNKKIRLNWTQKDGVDGWYDDAQNIHIRYYTFKQPSVLYCQEYATLQTSGAETGWEYIDYWQYGYYYYINNSSGTERFFVYSTGGWFEQPQYYAIYQVNTGSYWNTVYTLQWTTVNGVAGWYDVLVNNISIRYYNWNTPPTVKYCPTYSELVESGVATSKESGVDGYYYQLSNGTERFFVYRQGDTDWAKYQKYNSNTNEWELKYLLYYDSYYELWYDTLNYNIYINYHNTKPDVLFCPTYAELQAKNINSWSYDGKQGYRYYVTDKQFFFVYDSQNAIFFKNDKKQYALTWKTVDGVTGWYDSQEGGHKNNIQTSSDKGTLNSSNTPSVLYCPTWDEISDGTYAWEKINGKDMYTYYFNNRNELFGVYLDGSGNPKMRYYKKSRNTYKQKVQFKWNNGQSMWLIEEIKNN